MQWRTILLVTMLCYPSSSIRADEAKSDDIEFHTAAYSFPCRDKTPDEFAKANPDRKILEVSVRISCVFNIAEADVHRVEYRLKMPETFEICDYLPKTTIDPVYVGPIQVGQQESTKAMTVVSRDAGAKVGFQIPYVPIEVQGKYADQDQKENVVLSSVQMSMMPPKKLITAASTQDGGRTLHFKLQQSDQLTLQGDKDFAFLAAVPKTWKGECFQLECTAFLKGSREIAARRSLMIGLYNVGDLATKKQVEALARAETAADRNARKTSPSTGGAASSIARTRTATKPGHVTVKLSYSGVWIADDAQVEIYVDGQFVGVGSIFNGFDIQREVDQTEHSVELRWLSKKKTFKLKVSDDGNYKMQFGWDRIFGEINGGSVHRLPDHS